MTRLEKGSCVFAPVSPVEIHGKEEERFVLQQRVNARDKRLAVGIVAGEVPVDDLIGDRKESPMGTFRALDARLLADASNPLIATRGCVTRFPGFSALESSRINIVSSAKEGTKEPDLGVRRRALIDKSRYRKHRSMTTSLKR